MRFILEIELDDEAMQTENDVRFALSCSLNRGVKLDDGDTSLVRDKNGKKVGKWEVTDRAPGWLLELFAARPDPAPSCPTCGKLESECAAQAPIQRMYSEAFAPGSEEQQANDRAKAASADLPEGWPNNQPARRANEPVYSVIVGNVGTVYQGDDETQARMDFTAYADQSRNHYGRASGEPVTLMQNGEPISEHYGDNDTGDDDSTGPDAAELRRRRAGFTPGPQHERGE
jgi:hypothetical protein